MKQTFCHFLTLILLIAPLAANAYTEGRYTYTVADGEATITDFDHSGFSFGPLAIPSTLGDKPVTAIGDSAFDNCTSLTGVTIPSGVISIGDSAFKNCEYLASITIPEGVISIGNSAFKKCAYLTSVIIPAGVTIISEETFVQCVRLTSVTIPESVHTIKASAFFLCGELPRITIPSTVTSIGDAAFSRCSSLASITIPDGITAISSSMLYGCENLTHVTIPSSVTSIGQEAFRNCFSLPCVAIPASVSNIGTNAFLDCPKLFSVYFAGNAPPIDHSPFNGSPVIIYYLDGASGWDDTPGSWVGRIARSLSFNYTAKSGRANITGCTRDSVGTLIIPTTLGGNTVNMISDSAFTNCTSLIQVTIPAGIPSISSSAFNGCTSLTHIVVHPDNSFYSSVDGVLFNKEQSTLFKCPEGKPGAYTIPASVTSITNTAFRYCTALTGITLPANITSISSYMFCGCSSLTDVTIPATVTSIGQAAFLNCSSLTGIAIPASVVSIDTWAFRSCTRLTEVHFAGNAPTIQNAPFLNTPATIYYFANTTGWPPEGGLWAERPTVPVTPTPLLTEKPRLPATAVRAMPSPFPTPSSVTPPSLPLALGCLKTIPA